jgi:hypothetical protein
MRRGRFVTGLLSTSALGLASPAKALDVVVPTSILARADEVLE